MPLKNLSSTTSVTMWLLSTRGLGRHGSPDLVLIRAECTSCYIFARDNCSSAATTRLYVRERQEFLAALPEDLRNEILAAERDEESHQQAARQLQAAA
jgi:hypothetical protein